jgi:hypothetical protein
MPVEKYQSTQSGGAQYTIDYGEGWYIIERDGKVLKHVSSPAEMGMSGGDVSLALTRETAVADIEYRRGVEG